MQHICQFEHIVSNRIKCQTLWKLLSNEDPPRDVGMSCPLSLFCEIKIISRYYNYKIYTRY